MPNLQEKYKKEIIPKLKKDLELKNSMECPCVQKIVINTGTGKIVVKDPAKKDDLLKKIFTDMATISGQKPQIRQAKKSISGFKLREGMPIGARVTLRGERMYDFLERLINVVFPRIRDFKGIKISSIDKSGNITIGIKDQLTFPEISADNTDFFFGMEITIVTSTNNKEKGIKLLKELGIPFVKEDK